MSLLFGMKVLGVNSSPRHSPLTGADDGRIIPANLERVSMSGPFIEDIVRDLRHMGRGLRRSPGFATAVVLTLALGIGGNTAIFSVVDQLLLRPLP